MELSVAELQKETHLYEQLAERNRIILNQHSQLLALQDELEQLRKAAEPTVAPEVPTKKSK